MLGSLDHARKLLDNIQPIRMVGDVRVLNVVHVMDALEAVGLWSWLGFNDDVATSDSINDASFEWAMEYLGAGYYAYPRWIWDENDQRWWGFDANEVLAEAESEMTDVVVVEDLS